MLFSWKSQISGASNKYVTVHQVNKLQASLDSFFLLYSFQILNKIIAVMFFTMEDRNDISLTNF